MATKNGTKHKHKNKGSGPLFGLLAVAALLFVVAYEWRLHTIVSSSSEMRLPASTQRRSLRAAETKAVSPGAVWDEHSILLLEGATPLEETVFASLKTAIDKIASAAVVTWHKGREAAALAAAFNAAPLPAVVYLPPNCITGVTAECTPHVYQSPATDSSLPPDAGLVAEWLISKAPAYIRLVNDGYSEVEFVEQLPGGTAGAKVKLNPRQRTWMDTKLSAQWQALVNGTTVAAETRVTQDSALAVRRPGECQYFVDPSCEVSADAVTFTPELTEERAAFSKDRLRLLVEQPPQTPNFTADGYKMTKTPALLLEALQTFFDLHKANYSRETWSPRDTYVNHHEVTNLLVDLPEAGPMRDSIYAIMQEVMENWSGIKLKHSAIYGIRVYRRGSTLTNHVDRSDTHIISAIVNVAQKVNKPWPVEVIDHHGISHKIAMQPGDMVLYEGASCAHGREEPLDGDWFANVFIHMAPINSPVPVDDEEDEE